MYLSQWGAYVGLNQSFVTSEGTGSATEDFSAGTGVELGINYDYKIDENLFLVGTVSYQSLNAEITDSDVPGVTGDVKYEYIKISPKLYLYTDKKLILIAGLSYGINTKAEVSIGSISLDYRKDNDVDVKNVFALNAGFGYDTALNDVKIRPRVTYTLSLNDALESKTNSYTGSANILNIGVDVLF